MLSLNWIDIMIILLLFGAGWLSWRIGFFRQLFVLGGFFGALFIAGWLFPHILPIHDRTLLTLINANLVLLVAIYAAIRGFDLGYYLHRRFNKKPWQGSTLERATGMAPGLVAALILVWLLGAMVGRLPFEGFSNSVNDSRIIQSLDHQLPSIPAVFAEFNRLVDPNSQPYLFVKPKPQASFNFSTSDFQTAVNKAAASIARITGFGCGGLVTGSGFTIGQNLVATNAHVVAGVQRPIIKYGGHSFESVPVLFDANLDFAILRLQPKVHAFTAPVLRLAAQDVDNDTTVAALGYPGGNFTASPGIIRNNLTVFGRNIYDVGVIGRDVYEVQTQAAEGSSGGPLVLSDGRVAGVIFARDDSNGSYAYALASSHLLDETNKAQKSSQRVSTGVCLAD
jgi:S1-C subfamily serine protease